MEDLVSVAESIIDLALEIHTKRCMDITLDQALRIAQDLMLSDHGEQAEDVEPPSPFATFNDSL